ncbi:hypothetical protein C8F01DRAFT_1160330 [Mycena amicta]|nr:hypothetical protein C8F01DRAFT_1160330 [Mycena amicta]
MRAQRDTHQNGRTHDGRTMNGCGLLYFSTPTVVSCRTLLRSAALHSLPIQFPLDSTISESKPPRLAYVDLRAYSQHPAKTCAHIRQLLPYPSGSSPQRCLQPLQAFVLNKLRKRADALGRRWMGQVWARKTSRLGTAARCSLPARTFNHSREISQLTTVLLPCNLYHASAHVWTRQEGCEHAAQLFELILFDYVARHNSSPYMPLAPLHYFFPAHHDGLFLAFPRASAANSA